MNEVMFFGRELPLLSSQRKPVIPASEPGPSAGNIRLGGKEVSLCVLSQGKILFIAPATSHLFSEASRWHWVPAFAGMTATYVSAGNSGGA